MKLKITYSIKPRTVKVDSTDYTLDPDEATNSEAIISEVQEIEETQAQDASLDEIFAEAKVTVEVAEA